MMWDGGHGWWGFGPVFMLLFWALVIVFVVALVRWLATTPGAGRAERNAPGRARAILEERYARGEIDREEFESRKRDLET